VAVGLVVPDDFSEAQMARALRFSLRSARAIPMFWIRDSAAEALMSAVGVDLAAVRAGGPQALEARLHVHGAIHNEPARPPNVVAALPGSDPGLRDRWVVVSAHFDHLGVELPDEHRDSIFNGADDNASGTAAVLEVAEAMASLATAPARSVLFLLVSGEEEGLVGSNAFAASPTVPLGSIVADINMDMIGRNDPGTIIGAGAAYSSLGGTAVGLGTELRGLGLRVVAEPAPDQNLFGRSDQRSFACRNVPSLLLTSGLHEDYHRASDELSRLDTDKAARVARLAFYLAYLTANDPAPTTWTEAGLAAVPELGCF
jgi:Zn-dependent M28 family amino/carboxypeptidase